MWIGVILKKKIDISGVDSLSFLGIGDQNIKTIQEQVKAQIVVRGNVMQLDGTKEDIKLIELAVNEMILIINNKGFVEPEDIRTYLASLSNGEPASMNGVPSTCDAAAANDVQNGAVKRTTSFTW